MPRWRGPTAARRPPLPYPILDALQISNLRLRTQGIGTPRFNTPEAVVGWLGAVQSQEYGYAPWSLGVRAAGVGESAVHAALDSGAILRTHVLRPTWHYVLPQDIRWMQALTAPRVRAMMRSYDRQLELDGPLYTRAFDAIVRAVEGGRHRTRAELGAALAEAGIEARGQRLAHIVGGAEFEALICSGARRGKQITYALLSERAPGTLGWDGDEALAELTRRYFRSHGPATERDFRWWASLPAADARRGIEMTASELERIGEYWWCPDSHVDDSGEDQAHLLQAYDEMVVGYTGGSRAAMNPGGFSYQGAGGDRLGHAVLLNGQLAGQWKRGEPPTPFRPWRQKEAMQVQEAVSRYARFAAS